MHFNRLNFYLTICIVIFILSPGLVRSQIILSGTVYDSTKLFPVSGTKVISTAGNYTYTDSNGVYHINVSDRDSISFFYEGRPTTKFPIKNMVNYNGFDISLKVRSHDNYKLLKEVIVFSKTHKQDSIENRQAYAKMFNFNSPTLRSDFTPGSAAGFDFDEIINIFKFRRNRQILRFQKFLLDQEQEKYINYRFNSILIKKLTGLHDDSLTIFKKVYQPSYEFITRVSQTDFYQYIQRSAIQFRKGDPFLKPEFNN